MCEITTTNQANISYVTHVSAQNKGIRKQKAFWRERDPGPQLQLPNDAQRLPNYSDYRCIYVFSSADSAALLDHLLTRAENSRIGTPNKNFN